MMRFEAAVVESRDAVSIYGRHVTGLGDGQVLLSETFQQRKDDDMGIDVEYYGIKGDKSMTSRIDILECLVLKAHDVTHAEDILMLEAMGRKSTTR